MIPLRLNGSKQDMPAADCRPFSISSAVINKVVTWEEGDILEQAVDIIVVPKASDLWSRLPWTAQAPYCEQLATSEHPVLTKALRMKAKQIMHVIVHESDLEHCYLKALDLAKKEGAKSVAFPCLLGDAQEKVVAAAHVAFASVRKWVDRNAGELQRVVFVTQKELESKVYERLMPYHFPKLGNYECEEEEAGKFLKVKLTWQGYASAVMVSGTYKGWGIRDSMMAEVGPEGKKFFSMVLHMEKGKQHQYKFIVDGEWKCRDDQPKIQDAKAGLVNVMDLTSPKQLSKKAPKPAATFSRDVPQRQLVDLGAKVEELQEQMKLLPRLQEALASQEQEMAELRGALEEQQREKAELTAAYGLLELKERVAKLESQEGVKKLGAEVTHLQEEVEALRGGLRSATDSSMSSETDSTSLSGTDTSSRRKAVDDLEDKVQNLCCLLTTTQEELLRVADGVKELKGETQSCRSTACRLEDEQIRLGELQGNLQEKVSGLQGGFQREVEDWHLRFDALRQETQDGSGASEQLAAIQVEAGRQEKVLQSLCGDLHDLRMRVGDLEKKGEGC